LKKRSGYKKAFWDFKVDEIITKLDDEKVEELMQFDGIIKNKLKIKSVKKNAIAFIEIQKEYGSFYDYLYSFMPDNKPIKNALKTLADAPAQTDISEAISKDLKKRGMSFV
jgi:DNA-3-methyladenine glycosylase I